MASDIDDDERTNAVGLFNTARSYWRSAEHLNVANLKVTHQRAPVTFLFCHAIELYLKAYLRGAGKSVAELKQIGHRVAEADFADISGSHPDLGHVYWYLLPEGRRYVVERKLI